MSPKFAAAVSSDTLLDPSVLSDQRGIDWISSLTDEQRGRLRVPQPFVQSAEQIQESADWGPFFGFRRMQAADLRFPPRVSTHDVIEAAFSLAAFDPATTEPDLAAEAEDVASALRTLFPPPVADVLVSEWVFLASNSVVISRLKKPFLAFFRAGASFVQITTRRTLRLPQDHIVSPANYRKAGVKWIALTGSAAAAFVAPVLGGPANLAADVFFLLDP